MANDIESQIVSYFTWVEAGVGTALHREADGQDTRPMTEEAMREIVGLERQYHEPERERTRRSRRWMIAVAAAACLAIGAIAVAASMRDDGEQQPVVTPDETIPDRTTVTSSTLPTSTSVAAPAPVGTQSLLTATVAATEPLYSLSTDPEWPLDHFEVRYWQQEAPQLLIVGDGPLSDRPVIGVSAGLQGGSQYVNGNTATDGASESTVHIGLVDGTGWLSTKGGVPISVVEWPVDNGYLATMRAIGLELDDAVELAGRVEIEHLRPTLAPTDGFRSLVVSDAAARVDGGLFAGVGHTDGGVEVDCTNSGEAGAAAAQLESLARFGPYSVGASTIARRVGESFGPLQTELDGAVWMAGDWWCTLWSMPLDPRGNETPVFENDEVDRLLGTLVVVDEATLRSQVSEASLNIDVTAPTTTVETAPAPTGVLQAGQYRADGSITSGEWFATFTDDGTRVVAVGPDAAQVIDLGGQGPLVSLIWTGPFSWCDGLAVSPDGSLLWDGVAVRDTATGRAVLAPTVRGSGSFSSDGSLLAVAARPVEGTAVLDVATGTEVRRVVGQNRNHNFCPEFTAKDQQLFVQELIGSARFWDIATGEQVAEVGTDDALANLSPDGRFVALSADRALLEVASGAEVFTYTGQRVAFSPNTTMMADSGDDGVVHIWDLRTRQLVSTIPGTASDAGLRDEMFSPDGSRLVTVANGGAAIYDTVSGDLLATVEPDGSGVISAYFSPDGSRIVTANEDGTVWVRPAP